MNKTIDSIIHELQGVKALIAAGNMKRADELLVLISRTLRDLNHEVYLSMRNSGEVK